jgi:hypothetical protein
MQLLSTVTGMLVYAVGMAVIMAGLVMVGVVVARTALASLKGGTYIHGQ